MHRSGSLFGGCPQGYKKNDESMTMFSNEPLGFGKAATYERLAHEAAHDADALRRHLDPNANPCCAALPAEHETSDWLHPERRALTSPHGCAAFLILACHRQRERSLGRKTHGPLAQRRDRTLSGLRVLSRPDCHPQLCALQPL